MGSLFTSSSFEFVNDFIDEGSDRTASSSESRLPNKITLVRWPA